MSFVLTVSTCYHGSKTLLTQTGWMIWRIKRRLQLQFFWHLFNIQNRTIAWYGLHKEVSRTSTLREAPVFMYSSSTCFYLVCSSDSVWNHSVWKEIIWWVPCPAPFVVMSHGGGRSKEGPCDWFSLVATGGGGIKKIKWKFLIQCAERLRTLNPRIYGFSFTKSCLFICLSDVKCSNFINQGLEEQIQSLQRF